MGDLTPHFSREEFACHCGCGFDEVDAALLEVLEALRLAFDCPVEVLSGCRCRAHNEAVGGKRHSEHLKGRAADIRLRLLRHPEEYEALGDIAEVLGATGIGTYPNRLHVDVRPLAPGESPERWTGE